ncbi:DC-STAMP domain-containing protein 2 [Phlebotomus papatasi]|uniref:DC-STAMP domain-containing protein 2 n=1 Tax=Phlebotomus papatasi TaxID=29031 RepID=UPI0024844A16|nr:DC-STAMP domain-containing protein 2 [Phlebotomus papatasi]
MIGIEWSHNNCRDEVPPGWESSRQDRVRNVAVREELRDEELLLCIEEITTSMRFFKCFMVLLIPTLVSKRGRSAIVGYIFVLTLSGPVVNIMGNIEETVQSLSCAQEHLKGILQRIFVRLKRPFVEIKHMISKIQDYVLKTMQEIEDRLSSIRDKVIAMTGFIRQAFGWLKDISNLCQDTFGSPYEMCIDSLNRMVDQCKEELGIASIVCNVNYILHPLCVPMEILGFMCVAIEFVGEAILNVIEDITKQFSEIIKELFHFTIEFDSDFDFEISTSKNWTEIKKNIAMEIKKRTVKFMVFLDFMEILSLIFILWLFYKVFRYQAQYLKRDDYKNIYITRNFHEFEQKCAERDQDQVLPLRGKECDRYTELGSFWLIQYERRKLIRSFPFLLLSNIQIFTILFTDYTLHWILVTIREYEASHLPVITSGQAIVKVSGTGPLAEMYRNIVQEFDPILKGFTADFRHCLPNPSSPDFGRFRTIICLIVICWLFLLLEPLSLRAQQIVIDSYHPERARKRAAWLHGEILRRRKSFLAVTARKMAQIISGNQEDHQAGLFR